MTDRSQLEQPSMPPSPAADIAAHERVLTATAVEKTYRLHPWSPRGRVRVLTGADIALRQGEVVGALLH